MGLFSSASQPTLLPDVTALEVPPGKRVKHLNVVATGGYEQVLVYLEDVPEPLSVVLGQITIDR